MSIVLTYFGNNLRVIVNHYQSKNLKNKDNPQPSSYVRYCKDMEKVQRLNVCGRENSNKIQ
jgi:hypothetical protein